MERIIMHIDLDAFFASVEQRDNPKLKGKPVIVGGTSGRGVVATASYEARKYGVHSAMPVFMARKKCPYGIYVPSRHDRYREVSKNIFKIFYEITEVVEPVSIDEAYLDITNCGKEPLQVVDYIKKEIWKRERLTASIGISYNKFLAKLASDWNKPNGIKIIKKDMIPDILLPLSINKVHGMGKKSVKKMNNIGVFKIEDMYKLPLDLFIEYFGKFGLEIYERIRGIDNREVEVGRERKSIGNETTLRKDTKDIEEIKKYLYSFSKSISKGLRKNHMWGKTVTVKIKNYKFEITTKSKTLKEYINEEEKIYIEACKILDSINIKDPLRLIGLTLSNLSEIKIEQLTIEQLMNSQRS
ncbi:DNA polymerase IV [Clostridium cochlearium]|uniref:DNA polymerase IV n=1 Tax=Clostridium cochlearium TaxID=1494 RepID=UPI00214A7DFD|nr:DNA polymerase IV [Clostridium cochlearium]MCR1972272.1 DNA polymerase IV [Clostridium cochlearium]